MHWLITFRNGTSDWLPLLFAALLIMMVYVLWRTLQVMPRVTGAKTVTSTTKVSWADVAGLEEAKEELEEVVDFLRDPSRFEQLGARVPKGILLYGPPGTGKTLLAKAIANEAGARFYMQSASAFVEMFAGLGAARIRKLFEEARKNAPAIVFIDELDAVGAQRTGHGFSREQDQTLNQLLVELDGFEAREQVIVMGASNRLQDLDVALLRPGRFDRQVLVAAPDLAGREAILGVHTRGELLPVHKVTIVSRGSALGYTLNLPSEERYLHTTEEFEDLLKVFLAGRAAEQVVFGRITNGAANDLEKVTELARAMVFDYGMSNAAVSRTMRADNYALSEETKAIRDHEQARLTDEAFAEALRLLVKHRPSLDRIALALLDKETLDKDELAELLEGTEAESRSAETVGTVRVVAAD